MLKHMGLGALGGLLSGAIIAGLVVFALLRHETKFHTQATDNIDLGTQAIHDYQCRYGERREVMILGEPDNYHYTYTGQQETTKPPLHLAHVPGELAHGLVRRDYDEPGNDKVLSDYFVIPPGVSHGQFIIRAKPNSESASNDALQVGDLADRDPNNDMRAKKLSFARFAELEDVGWTVEEDVYRGVFSEVKFLNVDGSYSSEFETMQAFLQTLKAPQIIDIVATDDTIVDFAAVVLCFEPEEKLGVTLAVQNSLTDIPENIVLLTCQDDYTNYPCNGIYGDTPCSESLPLACYSGNYSSAPPLSEEYVAFERHWSGGSLRFTEPVRGDAFETAADADAYCASQFGGNYRIVEFHQGGEHNISAWSADGKLSGRAWIDIRNQPNGTCWARE